MNKISINHIKSIYRYNNNIYDSGTPLNFQITHNIYEMIERDLKFGVKHYDMCFLGNNIIHVYHKSNKKYLHRRKKIGL